MLVRAVSFEETSEKKDGETLIKITESRGAYEYVELFSVAICHHEEKRKPFFSNSSCSLVVGKSSLMGYSS